MATGVLVRGVNSAPETVDQSDQLARYQRHRQEQQFGNEHANQQPTVNSSHSHMTRTGLDHQGIDSANWSAAATFAFLLLAASTILHDEGHAFRALQAWACLAAPVLVALALRDGMVTVRILGSLRAVLTVFGGSTLVFACTMALGKAVPQFSTLCTLVATALLPAGGVLALLRAPVDPYRKSHQTLAAACVAGALLWSSATATMQYLRHHDPGSSRKSPKPERQRRAIPGSIANA